MTAEYEEDGGSGAMVWIWIVAGILVAGMLLLLWSDIEARLRFTRMEGDDHLAVDLRALFGLFRYRVVIPVIYWKEKGIGLKAEKVDRNDGELLEGRQATINRDKIERFFRRAKDLLVHTTRLIEWSKGVMARTAITEVSWVTRVGLGDAADTAITTGIVWGLKTSLLRFILQYFRLEAKPVLSVQPQFNRMMFSTEAVCKAKIKLVFVLYAMMMLIPRIVTVKGGLKTWRRQLFNPS